MSPSNPPHSFRLTSYASLPPSCDFSLARLAPGQLVLDRQHTCLWLYADWAVLSCLYFGGSQLRLVLCSEAVLAYGRYGKSFCKF